MKTKNGFKIGDKCIITSVPHSVPKSKIGETGKIVGVCDADLDIDFMSDTTGLWYLSSVNIEKIKNEQA